MFSPDFTNPSSWAWNATVDRELPWQHAGHAVLRGPLGLEPRARAQHQPVAAGTIQANPGVNANALRPYLGFGSITLYETTGTSTLQQPADAGRAPLRARRRLQLAYTFSTHQGRRQRPRRHPAERLRRQRLLRHLGSRSAARAGIAVRYRFADAGSSRRRRCAGCSATGTSAACSRRSRARPSTCARRTTTPAWVLAAACSSIRSATRQRSAPTGIDPLARHLVRSQRVSPDGPRHVRDHAERNYLRQPGSGM